PRTEVTNDYLWLPSCPMALPGTPGAAAMDCKAAHGCADPKLMSMTLFAHQLTTADGKPTHSATWDYIGSACRDPHTAGPTHHQRKLTWHDVLTAIRRIGPPASQVQAPTYTLVNLRTTFYTTPTSIDRTLTILGHTVEVHIAPTDYTWHWGDGTTTTSTTPGHSYPSTDVTHTYRHATDRDESLSLRVDITYTARYRVNHTSWHTIPDPLTVTGTPTPLPVKQASAVLTADR
ncbi:MAG: hypothetical protein ACRDQA_15550, partial [Nocardioidaceae bacterium]